MQTAICLLLVVFFLLMNAFFVIAEFALVRVRKSQIDMAVAEKRRGAEESLYRLVKECIVVMADETRNYDDRNRASHEEAKCIMEYLKAHGKHIPLR